MRHQQQQNLFRQLGHLLEAANRHLVAPFGEPDLRLTPLRRASVIRTLRSLARAIDVVVAKLEVEP